MNTQPSRILRFRKPLFVLIALFSLVTVTGLWSFSFSPMTASIANTGPDAVITYKVTNESDQQTAVAITVKTRSIDALGTEKNEPADKLFLVFPSRVVLKPNSSQNVKVQYRGPATLSAETAYRVVAEQLPVDFSKATSSGVSILLTYVAALYVAPKGVTPRLALSQAVGGNKEGITGLWVTVKNEGTRHALISEPKVRIAQAGGLPEREFTGDAVSGIDGQNLLALSERTFFVPWESAVAGATYGGSFDAQIE